MGWRYYYPFISLNCLHRNGEQLFHNFKKNKIICNFYDDKGNNGNSADCMVRGYFENGMGRANPLLGYRYDFVFCYCFLYFLSGRPTDIENRKKVYLFKFGLWCSSDT